jgi:hypothetical protein
MKFSFFINNLLRRGNYFIFIFVMLGFKQNSILGFNFLFGF